MQDECRCDVRQRAWPANVWPGDGPRCHRRRREQDHPLPLGLLHGGSLGGSLGGFPGAVRAAAPRRAAFRPRRGGAAGARAADGASGASDLHGQRGRLHGRARGHADAAGWADGLADRRCADPRRGGGGGPGLVARHQHRPFLMPAIA
ncbi:hypothetical protein D3869_05745 [Azospirillum brasilense]|uniref:Uncharacterized protein n=1 Tax=Azospirillum brasilense TaxID=192 RepID=A0A4D8QVA1_AZOBR|nr:hypothetical protein D3869_05745 [Azospirillum brasilense]